MHIEIELSLISLQQEQIQPLLEQFQSETGIRVNVRIMDWETAWNQLVRAALYHNGPDISEIGTTWTSDLIGMNALRPFEPAEITALGRADTFVPASWQNAVPTGGRIWAIPWLAGSRLIFYRPAILDSAGISPDGAFSNPEAFQATVRRLYEHGVRLPWAIPVGLSVETMHNMASWIWAEGGDFLTPDGRSIGLMTPESLRGMSQYFSLGHSIAREFHQEIGMASDDYFVAHPEQAITMSGSWLFSQLHGMDGEICVALPPGPSFVGGSNLVVWKYSRSTEAAVLLARFLTSAKAQSVCATQAGLMPVRGDTLKQPPFSTELNWQTGVRALLGGRTFPAITLWGLIEERLNAGFSVVWREVLAHPEESPRAVLVKIIDPLRKRLDLMLEGK